MTTSNVTQAGTRDGKRFFLISAIAMVLVIFAGFSLQLAMGRSSFQAPPLVHAHAIVFMGWVVIFLLQNLLIATGQVRLHRPLGWIAAAWLVPMLVLGCLVTVNMIREADVPFFFRPLHFLVFDPVSLIAFIALTIAAIALRRATPWHQRLHYCAMAILMGPALGRLLPMPLLIPWGWEATFVATLVFPLIGVLADLMRNGRVHPAWIWGIGAMFAMFAAVEAITYTPVGTALYDAVAAGSPGAAVDPLAFPPFPGPPPGAAPVP
ncbi:hypothetical protein [Brevundimonas sp. AJA228-03]|uniref:hypothetical protein n=1 Tax=Brevundimonas sp. AJA228-03 TaxID=2752515 RepID=UPI001AE09FC5|nr:hypothetical protein [Brevundimonas sp. AJA228-03]